MNSLIAKVFSCLGLGMAVVLIFFIAMLLWFRKATGRWPPFVGTMDIPRQPLPIKEDERCHTPPCDVAVAVATKISDEDLYDTMDPVTDMAEVIQAALTAKAEEVRERCAVEAERFCFDRISNERGGRLANKIRALNLTEADDDRK